MTAPRSVTRTRVWHWVHVCGGARIGERCSLGQNVFVGNRAVLGNNVRVQNNVSIYDDVTLEDDVFCGPSMVFTNVINPSSHVPRKDEYRKTLVKRGASIGANATVVCGVTIGEYAFVGAGAVVSRDVAPYALVTGVPARRCGWVCRCGVTLKGTGTITCTECGLSFTIVRYALPACFAMNSLPFIDLKTQYSRLKPEIDARIQQVLDHGQYIMGPEVAELESALAEHCGASHAIGVSDGTTALMIAMMALGIGAGDEVITTPFTFIATGEMISLLGAKPVFVDIDPRTFNLDPTLVEAAITPRTRAIMPVSLYGQCADLDAINAIASAPACR